MLALSGRRGRRPCPQRQSADNPRWLEPAGRGWQLVDYELAGLPSATKSRLVQGCRNIPGKEGSERATTVATPSWLRARRTRLRSTLPITAFRQVGLALRLVKMAGFPHHADYGRLQAGSERLDAKAFVHKERHRSVQALD